MICVLVVAAGAGWEPTALRLLGEHPEITVLKRCVDIDDLLAAASAGQADAAVLALDAPGLDEAAAEHLRRHAVRPVAVVPDAEGAPVDAARERAARIGLTRLVSARELSRLAALLLAEDPRTEEPGDPGRPRSGGASGPAVSAPGPARSVTAVWGPSGAPGRTTIAAAIASGMAGRGRRTVLVDADPWGGAVAQQWGILDESSGMLQAARLAARGDLADRFGEVQRALDERLRVITGLPRPDRWIEVRGGVVEQVVDLAGDLGEVVLDVGFCLEDDVAAEFGARGGRNAMTLAALAACDQVLVVGAADPVGLTRLARGLVELRELDLGTPIRVLVNRMRPGLGWDEHEITGMVEGFAPASGVHFLPEDRAGVDRAVVAGRTLHESGDSLLARSLEPVLDALLPDTVSAAARRGRVSWRRAGRARLR